MVGKSTKYRVKTLALACALTAASSQAEISLNGFASVVAGQTTEKDTSALGYSDSIDFKPDSLFALQASSDLGKGKPPKELSSDADIIKFVAENPGAIGYVDAASVDGSVKVLKKF